MPLERVSSSLIVCNKGKVIGLCLFGASPLVHLLPTQIKIVKEGSILCQSRALPGKVHLDCLVGKESTKVSTEISRSELSGWESGAWWLIFPSVHQKEYHGRLHFCVCLSCLSIRHSHAVPRSQILVD